jgi:hypothetical protein
MALGDPQTWNLSGTLLNGTMFNTNGNIIINPDPYVDYLRSSESLQANNRKSGERFNLIIVKSDP